jgi:NarL family two-component system sensor histidine kinase LiaS
MFKFFRHLQWKLTLSYAAVTAGTVIVLAALITGAALFLESTNKTRTYDSFYWSKTAFQDNIPYLIADPAALQSWLENVQKEGFASADFKSETVRESLDYARTLIKGEPIYVLDPDLNLIAAAPVSKENLPGKPFTPARIKGYDLKEILDAAQVGDKNYYAQSLKLPDGSYIAAFPLRKNGAGPVTAIVVYRLKPVVFVTPSNLAIYQNFFAVTTIIVILISLPVGAVFGWLVSRGLRKRLATLSAVSQAWSKGDFSVNPRDQSGDEIGELTRNLNQMAEQLRTLIYARNELARVEERNRLARDLHDTVKQQTYAARMQLAAAKNLIASDPPAAAEHIDAALTLNRETQQELKLIIEELRPAALDGKGLVQAIKEYTARWQEHTGIPVETSVSGDRSLPLDIEQALFRVLQESLSNVARHAEADRVEISLAITSDQATLTITDNGQGFDPDAVAAGSLGLIGMKQRMSEIGGSATIHSTPASGTTVIASANLKKSD